MKCKCADWRTNQLLIASTMLMYLYLQSDVSAERNVRSVKSSRIHRVAYQSDGSAFNYFRQNLLQPFLIKRVVDTEGSRRVQQASNRLTPYYYQHLRNARNRTADHLELKLNNVFKHNLRTCSTEVQVSEQLAELPLEMFLYVHCQSVFLQLFCISNIFAIMYFR